jgi:AcrR family transcriptional regulator
MSEASDRRERLKTRLADLAEGLVAAEGLAAVKARPLAEAAGCAVGAIYTVYPDLDALILTVNHRTLGLLDTVMTEAGRGREDDPAGWLEALGLAYLAFAAREPRRWRALFEHRTPEGYPIADWYAARLDGLFRHLRRPLEALMPERGAAERAEIANALFAGVHGIVILGLDGKVGAAPEEAIAGRIRFLVRSALAGARA